MRRRRFLALGSALLAGAGCQGQSDSDVTPVPPPTAESTRSEQETNIDVESAAVQPGVVGPNTPDSIGVFDADGQHLLVNVRVTSGPPPEQSAFRFHFDGQTYTPAAFPNGLYRGEWGVRYEDGAGPLVFDLAERGEPTDARLTWPGGEWTPPEPVKIQLADPLPPFEVSLDGPDAVTADEEPTISITVRNSGETAGQIALALNRTGPRIAYAPVERIAADLAPGEEVTRTRDAENPNASDAEDRETIYRLDAPGEDNDEGHRIRQAEAATETKSETA
jgi:hypothetical protein